MRVVDTKAAQEGHPVDLAALITAPLTRIRCLSPSFPPQPPVSHQKMAMRGSDGRRYRAGDDPQDRRWLLPLVFLFYLLSLIDRVNLGFAALTMGEDHLGLIPYTHNRRQSVAWLRMPRPAFA